MDERDESRLCKDLTERVIRTWVDDIGDEQHAVERGGHADYAQQNDHGHESADRPWRRDFEPAVGNFCYVRVPGHAPSVCADRRRFSIWRAASRGNLPFAIEDEHRNMIIADGESEMGC